MRKRTSIKQVSLLRELRQQIISGKYLAGGQLPIRSELETQFKASRVTVQRVLDRLAQDGFVVARGRSGTFVVDHPPHLCRYGFVFPFRPNDSLRWSRFFDVLCHEAQDLDTQSNRRMTIYYGAEYRDDESYAKLLEDIGNQCLSGLIFASDPTYLMGQSPMTQAGLPRVAIMSGTIGGCCSIDLDESSYINRVLDHFKARGRRKIAMVLGSQTDKFRQGLLSGIAARGMETRPYWTQIVSPRLPQGAQYCTHLLMHDGQQRPDGLLVADDHLVDHAMAGLIAAGVKAGDEADIVVHGNFPCANALPVPARRIGYDVRSILKTGMALIDSARSGRGLQETPALVPAAFEDELEARTKKILAA